LPVDKKSNSEIFELQTLEAKYNLNNFLFFHQEGLAATPALPGIIKLSYSNVINLVDNPLAQYMPSSSSLTLFELCSLLVVVSYLHIWSEVDRLVGPFSHTTITGHGCWVKNEYQ
jgi:hypothetical protein